MHKKSLLLSFTVVVSLVIFSTSCKKVINNYYYDCCCDTVVCDETSDWTGTYSELGGGVSIVDDSTFISGGIARLSNSPWSYYWTGINLEIPECRNLSADSIKLEARLQNPIKDGAIEQLDVTLWIQGENDTAWVTYIGRSFRQEFASLGLGGGNRITNVPELIQLFQEWKVVSLEAKNGVLSTYVNGVLIKSYNYSGKNLGKLKKINVSFKGTGSVDWVKVYDNSGTVKLKEEFNTDHTSTVEWF